MKRGLQFSAAFNASSFSDKFSPNLAAPGVCLERFFICMPGWALTQKK
jgi:hypothetical protein